MGIRFFKIVGVFSYIAAALALLAAVALAIIGGTQLGKRVDNTIQKPSPTVDGFLREQKAALQDQRQRNAPNASPSNESARKAATAAFQAKLSPLLTRIVSALDTFAEQTAQEKVRRDGLENYLIKQTPELQGDTYLEFLSSFAKEAEDLAGRAPQIARLPVDDPAYTRWQDFVTWFVTSYMEQYRAEQVRIQQERAEQAAGRIEALTTLGTAASAFLIFVFFTMILLLVKIEENTRRVSEAFATVNEIASKVELNTRTTALALRPRQTSASGVAKI